MRILTKVFVRVVVTEFYKENAGFLLIVLGIGGGFLKTQQHIDIASALAFQPIYYLVPLGLWVLYTFKTLNFFYKVKKLRQNWLLTDLNQLKNFKLKPLITFIQSLLLAPILLYSLFMAIIAIQLGQTYSALLIFGANGAIVLISAHLLFIRLVHPTDASLRKPTGDWTKFIPKTYSFLFIQHLILRHGIALIASKAFSIGIILGATAIFNIENVDFRFLALGILLSSAVNANFSFKYAQFESNSLSLYLNLPISKLNRFSKNLFTYSILCLPEFLILIGNNFGSINAIDLLKTLCFIPVMTLFYHRLVKWKGMNEETQAKYIFLSTATLFFVILAYVDLFLIEGIILSICLLLARFGTTVSN